MNEPQIRYEIATNSFHKLPGCPIAYWISNRIIKCFENKLLYDISISPSQNITGDNSKYTRFFWELAKEYINDKDKWIFYAKGGAFRKWYGNLEIVVNWSPIARNIYKNGNGMHASQIIKHEYWYKKGITWGLISSADASFRIMPEGATFDKGGSTIIVEDNYFYLVLSLLNSKVYSAFSKILNPTLNLQVKDVRSIPIIDKSKNQIDNITMKCCQLSQKDWDSFETSWDFKKHPLI